MRRCQLCQSRPAFARIPHYGVVVCRECFIEMIVSRVRKEIERFKMIEPGDRILLAVSGGKDSLTLLDVMAQIYDVSKMVALTIVEGIRGYDRSSEVEEARRIAKSLGIDHIVVDMRKEIGFSVDEFMEAQKVLKVRSMLSACTFCGVARRRILNIYARSLGTNKVATGHNLDDEVHTYIMNILRGDIMRLVQLHPLSQVHSPAIVKRIKPLRKVYEYETTLYAYVRGFHMQEAECPYLSQRPTLRARIREILYAFEYLEPGALMRFLETVDEVLKPLVEEWRSRRFKLNYCERCGEPTSEKRRVCKMCELIDLILSARSSLS